MLGSRVLIEQLEPRVLLDASPLCAAGQFTSASNLESSIVASHPNTPVTQSSEIAYDPAADINAIFHANATPLDTETDSQEHNSPSSQTSTPGYDQQYLEVSPGEVLKGSGNIAEHLVNHGTVSPGHSPGVQNFATFTQANDASTEMEIAGTGGPGAPNGYDQINVTGLAQLDGQLKITLLGGFIPSVGQTFPIFTWGSHTGEFSDWLGTTVSGHPELAFKPVYSATGLSLEVIQTPILSATAEGAITTGLNTMASVANALDTASSFAHSLPLIGDSIGNIVDMGSAFQHRIADQINSFIASFPREASVANLIENWNGIHAGAFTIGVKGVLGHYGATSSDPVSWDIHLTLTPDVLNQALQSIAGSVLGAAFGGSPTVDVHGNIELDLAFGYDSSFFVDIDKIEGSLDVNASGSGGGFFNFSPAGGPVSLTINNWSVDLSASLTATPDESILDGNGHIPLGTLAQIVSAAVPAQDAFNLEKHGTVDASFSLNGSLNVFGISALATTSVEVQSSDLFTGGDPDMTIEVNGSISVFNQSLSGDFIFSKTATDTTISASGVSLDLKAGSGAGAKRILHAQNGSGEFVLIDGDLAGTATLDITQGPEIPNISITGTTLSLALNATNTAVPTINGVNVNLPDGKYFRLSGQTTLSLTTPSASLSGQFSFESYDPTPGSPSSGDEVVSVGGTGLTFNFEAGAVVGLQATNVIGAFVINTQGIAGTAQGDVSLNIPGVELSGHFDILLNDRNVSVSQTVSVNGISIPINAPAGPYIRVMATSSTLRVLGAVTLTGNFALEQKQTTTGGENVVTISASNVSLDLGTTTSHLLQVTNGSGTFILTEDGLAGQASATVTLGVSGFNLTGAFSIRVNTTDAAVNETVNISGSPVVIDVPVGPYLQVRGTGVTLTVLGVSITGNFSFEQRQSESGRQVVTLAANTVSFNFGTSLIQLTNGQALFVITDGGMAGIGSITATINIFGGLSHTFDWQFNNTGAPLNEILDMPSDTVTAASLHSLGLPPGFSAFPLNLPTGPFNRISTQGPITLSLNVAGRTQSLTAELVATMVHGSTDYVAIGASNVSATLSAGPISLAVSGGRGGVLIKNTGTAGVINITSASLSGLGVVSLTARNLAIAFNNTGAAVAATPISVSDTPGDTVTVEFSGPHYNNFFGISGSADLVFSSPVAITLGGTFTFEVLGGTPSQINVAVENLHFDLKAGSLTLLAFNHGTGAFVFNTNGVAGLANLDFETGLIGLRGSIRLELNTTTSPVNVTIPTPSGSVNINVALPQSVRIYVNGHILIGSVALPFNFYVQINTGTGAVELREQGSNTLLVGFDPTTGAISTGLSFSDYGLPGPFQFVSMLRQLGNWIAAFREAAVFHVEIPFTGGKTLGDVFDWSQLFVDSIYSQMVSVELQSRNLSDPDPNTGSLANAHFKLKFGDEAPVEVTVSGNYGVDGTKNDLDELAALFNAAFLAAGINTTSTGTGIHDRLQARRNKDGKFVIALTPAEIAKATTLNMVDLDSQIEHLGFGPSDGTYGDAGDVTAEQVGVLAARYTTQDFFVQLGNLLGLSVSYDARREVYTYHFAKDATYVSPAIPFNFGGDLGQLAGAHLNGSVQFSASVGFEMTLGFDLGAREVPHVITTSTVPVPSNGQIRHDAHFDIFLNDSVSPISLVLSAAATTSNTNVDMLVSELNAVIAASPATYGGQPLRNLIIAQKAGEGLAISALNEDFDGDGQLGVVDEDANHNHHLDAGEDLDGDGVLDRPEDLNGNGLLDNQLGIINRILIRSARDDSFATELGFGADIVDVDGDPMTTDDQFLFSGSTSQIKGLFLDGVNLHANVSVTNPTPIGGSIRLGFVEISTSGGTFGTYQQDGTTPNPIHFNIDLRNQSTGATRFYISDLFNGTASNALSNLMRTPSFGGSVLLRLSNITVNGLGFAVPLGSPNEISVWIPTITDLHYNSDPYNGSNTGIFLTFPDLRSLANFSRISFSQIIHALQAIANSLSQLSAFSFLNEKLPFIDLSINDMVSYASRFADLIDAASQAHSQTLQATLTELKHEVDALFNLDPSVLSITLDDSGISSDPSASGGVNGGTAASATYNPIGENNGLVFRSTNLANAATFNGARIHVIGGDSISDSSAHASYDSTTKILTIEINGGVTTANAIIAAVAALPGHEWTATLVSADSSTGGNTGAGTISTAALKFAFNFSVGYANSLPFELDLQKLASQIAGDNTAAQAFLQAVTTLVQIQGSGNLTVSASASLSLVFGLDVTNPLSVKPFFYDDTGITLLAKVRGTNINIQASLGAIAGIWIKNGELTLDADGDPTTGPSSGDRGARFHLGLRNNNGDNRHYFTENWFDSDNIDLSMQGGASATLPIFAPFQNTALDGTDDKNGDHYPDNQLVINIPDLVRLFIPYSAHGTTADLIVPGANNNLHIVHASATNYEVEFENDPNLATPASASFSGNKLTITIKSGITSAAQALAAVQAVSGFGGSTLLNNDPVGANTGAGVIHKLTIITPNFAAMFDNLDLCALIDQYAGAILDGLDRFLGTIQDGLNAVVFSTRLPLIGDGLAGAANFISNFRSGLLSELREALASAGGSATTAVENVIKKAFWNTLGPGGLDILKKTDGTPLDLALGYSQLDVSLDCDHGLVVNLRLKKDLDLVDTTGSPIHLDIGIPGFGLQVNGNVIVSIGFDLKFGFGFDKEHGFYFNTSAPESDPELKIGFKVTIPGIALTGQLLFLQLDIADDPDHPSKFEGDFYVDLRDPNHDGKLTFAEMASGGTHFSDIVHANLAADANVNLNLVASFGGNASFPRVLADFHLDWHWDLINGSQDPQISFDNIYLDAGTFLSDFLGPILKEIRKITEPIQPIIDIVTARIPVLSDLAGEDLTLLDLARIFGLLEPSTVDFINDVIQVVSLINDLDGLGEGTILIPLGGFSLGSDSSGEMRQINPLQNLDSIDLEGTINAATGPGVSSTYQHSAAAFAGNVGSLSNFSIPIFQHPTELFNLFIGEPVRLIEWRMPQFKFEFTYTQEIPIYPPLYAQFGGSIGATINIGFGYDTFGIQKFISDPDKNPVDLLDGFYVLDFDASGHEQPELELTGEIFAGASINLVLVEAGVRGGITATIDFDLNDVNDDGKVRVSEIIANAQIDPRCIFDISGRLGLFLEAFLKIDLFFFSIDKTWRFADITLFEFSIGCPEPVLADQVGATLTLNIGSRAADRENIDTSDNAERFIVTHVGGSAGDESVLVQWGNYQKQFDHVGKIVVEDAGQGDDYLDFRGTKAQLDVYGGVGNDTIYLGDGNTSHVHGGAGNDTIVAAGGTDVILWGDDGNDTLTAADQPIEIHGGAGSDVIAGSPQADHLYGDDGSDNITGSDGNDTIEGGSGNDTIDAGNGSDWVLGGDGADVITGGKDDDYLDGGDGDDELLGGSGNDMLVGGNGNDRLFGHGGIDLLIGDRYEKINGLAVTPANLSSALAAIPVSGISVQGLKGSGNDFLVGGGGVDVLFGGEGADFLYGGNFFVSGDTEVIEEDNNDFFDGGPGNDTIFGDDAMGKTGDRNTGVAIKSSIFYDNNLNGSRDTDETGFGGVTVELHRQSDDDLIASTVTEPDGTFELLGLDPNIYYMVFSLPGGLTFTTKYAGGAANADADSKDSDVAIATGKTDPFSLTFDQTESNIAAGYTGPARVSITDVSVNEGNSGQTQAVFNVVLSGPQKQPVEIQYTTLDGTATSGSGDYVALSGTLVIEPGQTTGQMILTVNGDTTYENDEQFELKILRCQRMDPSPTNLDVTDSQILVTVVNDDPVPQISIADYVPQPGAAETAPATFHVTLSNPSAFPVSVLWRVDSALTFQALPADNAGTPSGFPGADFNLPPGGTLTFLPGETDKQLSVTLLPDSVDENDEHFFVDLYDPSFARIADGHAYGIIPDDDPPVSVSIVPTVHLAGDPANLTHVTEGNSSSVFVTLKVKLSAASGKQVVVNYATAPGTAIEAALDSKYLSPDYVGLPNHNTPESEQQITFEAGETEKFIKVEVLPDNLVEGPETFYVNIMNAVNATIAGNASESNHVAVQIDDDDTVPDTDLGPWNIRFSDTDYTVKEPTTGIALAEITLMRAAGSSHAVAVFYTTNGSATAGADYGAVFRQLVSFGPGEIVKKVYIPIYSDSAIEGDETVHLSLRNPTGGPVKGTPSEATLTIKDADAPRMWITPPVLFTLPTSPPIDVYGISEGSGNVFANKTFKVHLAAPAGPAGAKVSYETVSLSARAGTDFTATSGTLFIPGGSSEGNILVPVFGDNMPELSETFAVRLKNAQGATLAVLDSSAIATIYDDDQVPVTGNVFFDSNANGIRDLNEGGIPGVSVAVKWFDGPTEHTTNAVTNSNGDYNANVNLGQVSIVVDGSTVHSPWWPLILFGAGAQYDLTTHNDNQSVQFDGAVGISPFSNVGYKSTFTFAAPKGTKDVGRGGTDDTIFGGPGDDTIDAGAGDDHVVAGHWMTATDGNAPINLGKYDAVIKVKTSGLASIYDSGPIFEVDTSSISAGGSISGRIFQDLNNSNQRDSGDTLLTQEVVVNLFDCNGNPVNSIVTTDGTYKFTGLYLHDDGTASDYVVEFMLPSGFTFASPDIGSDATDSDAVNGPRTNEIIISKASPSAINEDAGVRPSNLSPAPGAGNLSFSDPSYSARNDSGYVTVKVVRQDSTEGRSVVVKTHDGTAINGVNYSSVSTIVWFDIGSTMELVKIPILPGPIDFCDNRTFTLELRDSTGRPFDNATVYVYAGGTATISDDDNVQGGDDWDIILGDSGNIPAVTVISNSASLLAIADVGGPGKDTVNAGDGLDYVKGQLGDDVLAGNEGQDTIFGGLGDDKILAELDNDTIDGEHGTDTIVSSRDVPLIQLISTSATDATLIHRRSLADFPLSTFTLHSIEVAKLFGGSLDNTFDIESWNGSAYISGGGGSDTLLVKNDTNMVVKDASLAEGVLYLLTEGFFKDSSISLSSGATYHLGSIEHVKLTGGPGANTFNASGYSRPVQFEGLAGDDTLIGGSADDTFLFTADTDLGTDTITGNGGSDTLDFSSTTTPVTVDLEGLLPAVQSVNSHLSLKLTDEIENATGGAGNDNLSGNSLDNVLLGGPGDDTLAGRAGNERYVFNTDQNWGSETIIEQIADAGHDILDFSGTLHHIIKLNMGVLGTAQTINLNLTLTLVGEGIEEVIGGALNDIIRGNSNDNTLRGGPGDDVLDGKSGDDYLDGGLGNDNLDGGLGSDYISEIANTNFALSNSRLQKGAETDILANIERADLTGGVRANTFDLTGWTGSGKITGVDNPLLPQLDTLIAGADANFTLTDSALSISTSLGPITLSGVDVAILTGGPGNNTLDATGFSGLATLNGGDGNDTLIGGSGADTLYGGAGNDTLTGNGDNDLIDGGADTDQLVESRDAFLFALSNNRLVIDKTSAPDDEEIDTLAAIEMVDLTGGASVNRFDLSAWTAGAASIHGGGSFDGLEVTGAGAITITNNSVTFTGGAGTILFDSVEAAVLRGSSGDDVLDASSYTGNAALLGGDGNDILISGLGNDVLQGGNGDDIFRFAPNAVLDSDTVSGGAGADTLDFGAFSTGVTVDLSLLGAFQIVSAGELRLRLTAADVENLIGTSAADNLTGNALNNTFQPGAGADVINGSAGQDTIQVTADANMVLTNNSLDVGGVTKTFTNVEIAVLTGGAGANTLDASVFNGSARLSGEGGDDILIGGNGNDILIGGAGNDTLRGGAGNDLYIFNVDNVLGDDSIDELSGAANGEDTIDFGLSQNKGVTIDLSLAVQQTVTTGNLRLKLIHGDSIENVIGTQQADVLRGNILDNKFLGNRGDDVIDGGVGGIDTVYEFRDSDMTLTDSKLVIGTEVDALNHIQRAVLTGGQSSNTLDASGFTGAVELYGQGGDDVLIGGRGNDLLQGGDGNDRLFGSAGNDSLFGGKGDDILNGGMAIPTLGITDNDSLAGGDGNDIYVFDQSGPLGTDTVTELAGQGAHDTLQGAGINGINVNLQLITPQIISANLTLVLANLGQVEHSFP